MPPVFVNHHLLRLRKAGKLSSIKTSERTSLDWEVADAFLFASEIAWRTVFDQTGESLDDIFCNPSLAALFDETARRFAPGYTSFQYRWGALKLRKEAKSAATRSLLLNVPSQRLKTVKKFGSLDGQAGLYMVGTSEKKPLYIGEALNLGGVLSQQFSGDSEGWASFGDVTIRAVPYQQLPCMDITSRGAQLARSLVAYQCHLIQKSHPQLNSLGLKETTA